MSSPSQPEPIARVIWVALAIIVCGGLAARLCHIMAPATDFPADRQITTALLAEAWAGGRSVSDYHFSHPINDDARVLMPEAPILPALAGLTGRALRLSPAATFTAARVWTIVFSLASITLLFAIGHRWMGAGAGLWAATLFAFLPASVYLGRAVTPDVPMTTFALLAVLATDRWIEQRRHAWAALAGCALFSAVAAKLYGGVALLPVMCLLVEGRQVMPRVTRRWAMGGAVAVVVVAVFACYPLSPLSLFRDLDAMSTSTNSLLQGLPASLTSAPHWVAFANRIDLTLTAGGALLAIAGVGVALAVSAPVALLVWLAAQAAFTFIATGANTYWTYALLAPATLCAGATLSAGMEWSWRRGFSLPRRLFACGAIALLPLLCVLLSRSPGKIARSYYQAGERLSRAGEFVAARTSPGTRLAAAGETPFDLLWLTGRKGWSLRPDEGKSLVETECDTLAVFRPTLTKRVFTEAFARRPITATARDVVIFQANRSVSDDIDVANETLRLPQPVVFDGDVRLERAGAVLLSTGKPTTVAVTLLWSTPSNTSLPFCLGLQWRPHPPDRAGAPEALRTPTLAQAINLEGEFFTRAQFAAVASSEATDERGAVATQCLLSIPEHFPPGQWRMGVSVWRNADDAQPLPIVSPSGAGRWAWLNVVSVPTRQTPLATPIDPADAFLVEATDGRLVVDGLARTDRPVSGIFLDIGAAPTTRVVTLIVEPHIRLGEFCAVAATCGSLTAAPVYHSDDNGHRTGVDFLSPPGATGATIEIVVSSTPRQGSAPIAFPLYPGEVHTKPSFLRLPEITTRPFDGEAPSRGNP